MIFSFRFFPRFLRPFPTARRATYTVPTLPPPPRLLRRAGLCSAAGQARARDFVAFSFSSPPLTVKELRVSPALQPCKAPLVSDPGLQTKLSLLSPLCHRAEDGLRAPLPTRRRHLRRRADAGRPGASAAGIRRKLLRSRAPKASGKFRGLLPLARP